PDIAHAVQSAAPAPAGEPVEIKPAESLRRLALDKLGVVNKRGRSCGARLFPPGPPARGAAADCTAWAMSG
ncbi:hypothetical protein ACWM6E_24425, partial [Cupriavidus necator]